ncbi:MULTISPECIES: hypothetical protein [Burkholderia]|uniref:hypothetical protein n=1 Tax=Burkholderia TaxID=32008 RepID=UPI00158D415D|nr:MULTISPECIES: hypothetical protein [Burkholderia]
MLKRLLLAIAICASFLATTAQASDSANLQPNHAAAFAEGLYAKPGLTASGVSVPPLLAASDSAPRSASTESSAAAVESRAPEPVTIAPRAVENGERSTSGATVDRLAKPEEGVKWSDILLAVATLLLAAFTAFLWLSTRGLLIEAKRAGVVAENSAKAAQSSAEAAANAVKAIVAREQPRWLVAEMEMTLQPIVLENPAWYGVATVTL